MSPPPALTRRGVLASLGMAAVSPRHAIAAPERPRDVGIGGTGAAPEGQDGTDRGIGGTGFVGTIQRFGSIVVNDRRIAYGPDVPVTIDGLLRSARDLRVGHVVRVVAIPASTGLVTRAIRVDSEVAGPVTAVGPGRLEILGQRVLTARSGQRRAWHPGEHVAVSGLRRLDGAIDASLIEPRKPGRMHVYGVLEQDEDGFWIGDLKLLRAERALLGRRVLATGLLRRGGFDPAQIEDAPALPPAGSVSIESYVRARDGRLLLGSGLSLRSDAFDGLPAWADVRAVLDGRLGPDGALRIDSIRLARGDGGGDGPSPDSAGPHGPGPQGFGSHAGPGGFGPGGFGHGPAGGSGSATPGPGGAAEIGRAHV